MAIIAVFVLILSVVLAALFSAGVVDKSDLPGRDSSDRSGVDGDPGGEAGPWTGLKPKKELFLRNSLNQTVDSGSITVLSSKPDSWRDTGKVDEMKEDDSVVGVFDVSGESVTLQASPGKYYFVGESDSSYTEFGELVVPDGGGRNMSLSEYNEDPDSRYVVLDSRYNVSGRVLDLGVVEDTDSRSKWSTGFSVEPFTLTEYRPSKMVFEVGDVDMTDYSFSESGEVEGGEGVTEFYFDVSGASSGSFTVFDPGEGVDRFGVSDSFVYSFEDDVVLEEDESLRFDFFAVTSFTSTTGPASGDGILTDGENLLRFRFVDESGRKSEWFELGA